MSPALAESQEFLAETKYMHVGGRSVQAISEQTLPAVNPATEESLGTIPAADEKDVDAAVAAAARAFEDPAWARMDPHQRAHLIHKIGDVIDANVEELAQIESLDTGMPLAIARQFVAGSADAFRYFSGWTTKIFGDTNPSPDGQFNYTLREPLGVCAQIMPWNGPVGTSAWKIAPAIAMGNTVVVKPAEQASLGPLRLAQLIAELDIPDGVINFVTGLGEVAGAALVQHPGVAKVSFTGSTDTGRVILRAAAENFTKVTLETGGKSPNIVFADADLDAAAQTAATWFCFLSGQICSCPSRLLVQRDVYHELLGRLTAMTQSFPVGDPLAPTTFMGPLISDEQLAKVQGFIAAGRDSGLEVAYEGPSASLSGYFQSPVIFSGVDNSYELAREEIFGPVVAVIPFSDEEEAVRIANDTKYGLAAGVWTSDVARAHRVSRALKAGTVWINHYGLIDVAGPWGGYKLSGVGRELGHFGVEAYTQPKSVSIHL
jgi:acyl-CoA reductase-like NAD-dependent aldehyde dehydrogenase